MNYLITNAQNMTPTIRRAIITYVSSVGGCLVEAPETLKEMYESNGYQSYIGDKLGNDLYINNPERAYRIHAADEDGCDGSTYAEGIGDWRDYLGTIEQYLTKEAIEAITSEIDECEQRHADAGTLDELIGW